jgi:peptidoglycan-associated lipoprotein
VPGFFLRASLAVFPQLDAISIDTVQLIHKLEFSSQSREVLRERLGGNIEVRTLKAVRLLLLIIVLANVATGCRGCLKGKMGRWFGGGNADSAAGIESCALPEPIRGQEPQQCADLVAVYYEFDSASLLEPAKEQLVKNASWLNSNPTVQVQLAGHCDSRGTADYNYALGQKRADSARSFLVQQGVDGSRLHTISYGADRPADPSDSETAYARNRRAEFLVY